LLSLLVLGSTMQKRKNLVLDPKSRIVRKVSKGPYVGKNDSVSMPQSLSSSRLIG
jgi:hypothetical protein